MNYVISLIVTYLFFNLLIVIPINYIKQTNYGKSLPLIFTSSVLVLYLSQIIFKSFLIGFYLLLILALLGLYLSIKKIKENKSIIQTSELFKVIGTHQENTWMGREFSTFEINFKVTCVEKLESRRDFTVLLKR